MGNRRKLVLVVLSAFGVGYALGPPLANAVSTLVIQGAGSTNKAKVSNKGRLLVDTEADVYNGFAQTFAFTRPDGEAVIASGSDGVSRSGGGTIASISLDVAPGAAGPVLLTVRKGTSGTIVWRGSVPTGGGHITDTFEGGIWMPNGLTTTVSNPNAADVQYSVLGDGLGVVWSAPRTLGR